MKAKKSMIDRLVKKFQDDLFWFMCSKCPKYNLMGVMVEGHNSYIVFSLN